MWGACLLGRGRPSAAHLLGCTPIQGGACGSTYCFQQCFNAIMHCHGSGCGGDDAQMMHWLCETNFLRSECAHMGN